MVESASTATLTPIANIAFWRAMPIVRREIPMALTILEGLSSIKTTSAASMAASLPSAPMAIPISARANTGASFIPSPTKARVLLADFSLSRRSTCSTLSAGISSL